MNVQATLNTPQNHSGPQNPSDSYLTSDNLDEACLPERYFDLPFAISDEMKLVGAIAKPLDVMRRFVEPESSVGVDEVRGAIGVLCGMLMRSPVPAPVDGIKEFRRTMCLQSLSDVLEYGMPVDQQREYIQYALTGEMAGKMSSLGEHILAGIHDLNERFVEFSRCTAIKDGEFRTLFSNFKVLANGLSRGKGGVVREQADGASSTDKKTLVSDAVARFSVLSQECLRLAEISLVSPATCSKVNLLIEDIKEQLGNGGAHLARHDIYRLAAVTIELEGSLSKLLSGRRSSSQPEAHVTSRGRQVATTTKS